MNDNYIPEKFQDYHALNDAYPKKFYILHEELTTEMSDLQKEQLKYLVEMAHKVGFLDAIAFMEYLNDKIY